MTDTPTTKLAKAAKAATEATNEAAKAAATSVAPLVPVVEAPAEEGLPAGFVRCRVTKFGVNKIFTGEVIGLVNQYRQYGEIFVTNILRAQALEAKGFAEIQE